jgi:hypothetical protein
LVGELACAVGHRVDRYSEQREIAVVAVLLPELLPDRQLVTTASPRGPAEDQESPAAERADLNLAAVEQREPEVGEEVTYLPNFDLFKHACSFSSQS